MSLAPRRQRGLVCAAAFLGLCLAAPAHAAAIHGPTARLKVEGRFETDLLANGGGPSGMLQPELGWRLEDPATRVGIGYGLDVVHYFRGGPVGLNHRLHADQRFEVDRRTTLTFSQRGERVYDPTALSRVGVVRAPGETSQLQAGGELAHRIDSRTSVQVGYLGAFTDVDAVSATDGFAHAPYARLLRALGARDDVGIGYRMQIFDALGGAVDARSHEPSAIYLRRLLPELRLEAELGPAFVEEDGEAPSITAHGRIALAYVRPRVELTTELGRSFVGAAGLPGALWAETAIVSGTARLSEGISLRLALAVFRNGRASEREAFVDGFTGGAVLEHKITDEIAAQLAWRRVAQQDRDGVAVDLSRNIVAAGLMWTFNGGRLPR